MTGLYALKPTFQRSLDGLESWLVARRVHPDLLTGTALTVRQVAARVGFTDPAYFCRFFRRETGLSPGRFRENHHEGRV